MLDPSGFCEVGAESAPLVIQTIQNVHLRCLGLLRIYPSPEKASSGLYLPCYLIEYLDLRRLLVLAATSVLHNLHNDNRLENSPVFIPCSRSDRLQLIGLRSILLGAKRHSAELLTISVCCPLTPF